MALLIVVVELTYQGYPGQPLVLTTLTGGRGEVVRGALDGYGEEGREGGGGEGGAGVLRKRGPLGGGGAGVRGHPTGVALKVNAILVWFVCHSVGH